MARAKIIFTNSRGDSVTLDSKPFKLLWIDGTGGTFADVQTQKAPYQDGQTYIDSLFEQRYLELELAIFGSSREEVFQLRRQLNNIFNPKLGPGILRYEYPGGVREIEAVPETTPSFPIGVQNSSGGFQRVFITLICPVPFWLDPLEQVVKLEDFVANFRFPFHFPVVFSVRGDTRTIINDGDVPTPITVEFRGHAINPRITNVTTGEFIQVNREIPENYRLVIDTEFGRKRVSIIAPDGVETNAFHYIDLESTFFDLEVGENQLSFITSGGSPEVYVHFKKRYVGV